MARRHLRLSAASVLLAAAGLGAAVQPQVTYRDPRVLGMGGAFTALADDRNALFYNPAGLALVGLKPVSVPAALVNPAEWRPRRRNIPEIVLLNTSLMANNSLFNEEKQKAVQTLIELGIIPADVAALNRLYNGYASTPLPGLGVTPRQLDIFRLVRMGPFTVDTNHYGWGNLTYSQLERLAQAMDALGRTVVSFSADTEWLSVAGPFYGFGVFSSFDQTLRFGYQGMLPDVRFRIRSDLAGVAGFGLQVPSYKRLSVGVAVKTFLRATAKADTYGEYLTTAAYDWTAFFRGLSPAGVAGWILRGETATTNALPETVAFGLGTGFDLGAIYRLTQDLYLGARLSDVYTRIRWLDGRRSSAIPPNLAVGVAWKPRLKKWSGPLASLLFESPVLTADLDDLFFNYSHNIFLKTHFGFEFRSLWRFLNVRLGLNQGYPTVGVGLDFSLYGLSQLPLVGWLRPDSVYLPQFDPNKRDHCQRHPCCCLATSLLAPILYAHVKVEYLNYARELGSAPGLIPDRQSALRLGVSWSY